MLCNPVVSPPQMKTGPFAEHSNQLWNISAVPNWAKVNQGLIRMYKAEVGKRTAHIALIGLVSFSFRGSSVRTPVS